MTLGESNFMLQNTLCFSLSLCNMTSCNDAMNKDLFHGQCSNVVFMTIFILGMFSL